MKNVLIIIVALAAVLVMVIPMEVSGISTTSNHYKWCIKQKDKKIRSLLCPDVFSLNETAIRLYG